MDYPAIDINVDRSKAGQVGLTQRDVATSLLISLSSSGQIAPTQLLDWRTGVSYGVAVQTPQYRMDSLDAVLRTPISSPFSGVNTTTATSIAGSANPTNAGVGAGPNQSSAAYGNPGRGLGRSAAALQSGDRRPRRRARNRQPLQRAAGDRRVRQRGPPRPRQCRRGSREDRRRDDAQAAARHHHRPARTVSPPCRIRSTASAWA